MIKTLNITGIKGTLLNTIKAIYKKPTANVINNVVKLKVFSLRFRTRQGCPFSFLFNTRNINKRNKTRKRNKPHAKS